MVICCRDVLFLDIASESSLRTQIEAVMGDVRASATNDFHMLLKAIISSCMNASLSTERDEELSICSKAFQVHSLLYALLLGPTS